MLLEVPDEIARRAETNESDLRVTLAIQLYAENRIDHTDACRLARLSSTAMNRHLLQHGITIQEYPPASVRKDRPG